MIKLTSRLAPTARDFPDFAVEPALSADMADIMRLEHSGFDAAIVEPESTFRSKLEAFPAGFLILRHSGSGEVRGYFCSELWNGIPDPELDPEAYLMEQDPEPRFHADGRTLYTASVTVDPALRGTGLGAWFFRTARLKILGAHPHIAEEVLVVNPLWEAALRLYRTEGFAVIGTLPSFFPDSRGGVREGLLMRRSVP